MSVVLPSTDPRTLDGLRARQKAIYEIARRHHATNLRVTGSVARGDASAESDVDLIADFDRDRLRGLDYFGNLDDLREALTTELACKVDVMDAATIRQALEATGFSPTNYQKRVAGRILRDAIAL